MEEILAHFCDGKIKTFDELLEDLPAGQIKAAWVSGGYHEPWIDDTAAEQFAGLDLVVVQDMFDSPLWRVGNLSVAGSGFRRASRLVCEFRRAAAIVHLGHPAAARRVGRRAIVLGDCSAMRGLYNARASVRRNRGGNSSPSARRPDEIPLVGIDLRVNQLAGGALIRIRLHSIRIHLWFI